MRPSAPWLILASASPRREELLRRLGLSFSVVPSQEPEELPPGPPEEAVRALALAKARTVASRVGSGVVLGADTIVVLDGAVLGKPKDRDDARRMLRALEGRSHHVITGLALVEAPAVRETSAAVVTRVQMARYGGGEIEAYLATGEPYDKAGAYAIQGRAGAFVTRISGSYSGIMGLPLAETAELLKRFDIPLL